MSVIRQTRRTAFTVVDNVSINDERLSLRAKGLHVVLLSKPDHWEFSSERLVSECREGRDAIRTALRELREAGYVREVREQGERGYWTTVIEVSEVPTEDIPVSSTGRVGVIIQPKTGFQGSVDRGLGEPKTGGSGDEVKTEEKRLRAKKTYNPRAKARAQIDEPIATGELPDEDPSNDPGEDLRPEPDESKKHTAWGLAESFAYKAGAAYPGSPAAYTAKVGLRRNIAAWHRDGVPYEVIKAAIDRFLGDARFHAPGVPLWQSFVNNWVDLADRAARTAATQRTEQEDDNVVLVRVAQW